jgi:hypothetical protein
MTEHPIPVTFADKLPPDARCPYCHQLVRDLGPNWQYEFVELLSLPPQLKCTHRRVTKHA